MPTGRLDLIADIGGTNARFALTDPEAAEPSILSPMALRNAEFASLQHAAEFYLASVDAAPRRAAIAVASPVDSDEIRLTNRAWSFSRSELQQTLGLDELRIINDFGAVARAMPSLRADERVTLYAGNANRPGPITVIGPGTGFGVAILVGDDATGWRVVDTEGGHVSFAPLGDEEHIVERWLTTRFGRASTERVLSGAGLSHIDAALRGADSGPRDGRPIDLREPADIVAAALDGHDLAARRALARFCSVLGSVAGDAALIHGARALMIAGGIVPRFIPFLRASAFRERFLAKGRFAPYLESVAIHVVTHPHPGLLGTAAALREPAPTPRHG
jgi:glucokinase